MIGLGLEERLERLDPGDDRGVEYAGLVELLDVRLGDLLLPGVCVEDRRAILPADVGALTIELRRVVRDRKEHFQQLPIGDPARIEADLHHLGMLRRPTAHGAIVRGFGRVAGVS